MRSETSPTASVYRFHYPLYYSRCSDGNAIRLVVLPLSELALRLNGPGDQLHATTQAGKAIAFRGQYLAVLPENLAERHNVAAGDPQHR